MTTEVYIIAFFAIIALCAFLVFRKRASLKIRGPLKTELDLDASNEDTQPEAAVKVKDAKSRKGGLKAHDSTGRGSNVESIDVDKDIEVTSSFSKGVDQNSKK